MPRPADPTGLDPAAVAAAHGATRVLLAVTSPREVVEVVFALVEALGGAVIPARLAGADTLPLDLSFGVEEPMLARADPAGVPRLHLEVLLPAFLEDARRVVMELRRTARDDETIDQLTGLLNRRSWDRRHHQLTPGDAVALIDLRFGPADAADPTAHDAMLASFGLLLRGFLRADALAARYGPDEMVVGAPGLGARLLGAQLDQLRRVWEAIGPHSMTFAVGVAGVGTTPTQATNEARSAALRTDHGRTEVLA